MALWSHLWATEGKRKEERSRALAMAVEDESLRSRARLRAGPPGACQWRRGAMQTRKEGPSLECCFASQLSWAEMPSVTPRQPDCHIQQNIRVGLGTTSTEFSLCMEPLAHPAESNSPLHVQVCLPGRRPQRKGLAGLDYPPSPLMANAKTDPMVKRALCPQEDHCLRQGI